MTTQDSEDELDTILTLLENSVSVDTSRRMVGGRSGESTKTTHARAKAAIQSLIRTEKLKLLAEVRERVVGEDLPPDVATDSGIGYSRQQFAINVGKAGQRKVLTKLEAEL